MNRLVLFVFTCVLWISCNSTDEKGFSETSTGLKYQIHSIGDVADVLNDSDVCNIEIKVFSLSDSVLYTSNKSITILYQTKKDSGLMEWMGLLAINDSSTAIISSKNIHRYFPKLTGLNSEVKMSIVIKISEPYAQWIFYKKYPELRVKDLELEEQVQLDRLLSSYKSDSIRYVSGIFLVSQVKGSGRYPKLNDEVVLHSNGKTISGKLIESTAHRKEAFSYIIGQKDQVISGFDIAVRQMRKGERCQVIIPSHLAYGKRGSSTRIVKPYETLIFEIEILDVIPPSMI
jgi:hypothetical protein